MLDKLIAVPSLDTEAAFVYRMAPAGGNTDYSTFINMQIKTAATAAIWTYRGNFVHRTAQRSHGKILLKFADKNKSVYGTLSQS